MIRHDYIRTVNLMYRWLYGEPWERAAKNMPDVFKWQELGRRKKPEPSVTRTPT